MTTLSYTVSDSKTMLRRNLVRAMRYPIIFYLIAMPVIFLVLFVYVFGGTLGAGLASGDTASYLEYVVPGILLLTIAVGMTGPAISVSQDMTEGIIARFRTMDISRSAVLAGHVLGSVLQHVIAVAIVFGVALLMGFRTTTNPLRWLGALGVVVGVSLALSWLGAAIGVYAKGVESASNIPTPVMLLPLLGSGFVPTESMPGWLKAFADYQPFTPFVETLRSLLSGTPIGSNGLLAFVWCAVIGIGGWMLARFMYERRSVLPGIKP